VCSRILATSSPPPSSLEVTFELLGGAMRVIAQGDGPLKEGSDFLTSWSRAILESVTEGFDIAQPDGRAMVSFQVSGA
jgi:hypothetical protein